MTLFELEDWIRFWRIALIDQKSSAKSAQFPFTMVPTPLDTPGPCAMMTPTGFLQKEGCPALASPSAGAETAPHHPTHRHGTHFGDPRSGIERDANTSRGTVKHNVVELGGLGLSGRRP